jgi:purine-binding chemotaxis protein CheW
VSGIRTISSSSSVTLNPATGDATIELMVLEVAAAQYAVLVHEVDEVLRASEIVPLPGAPRVVEGVIDYRGRIVPVLDLRARFGHPRRAVRPEDHYVVLRAAHRVLTLRTDRVLGLARVSADQVHASDAIAARTQFVAGLATLPDGVVLIVDAAAFLSESETILLDDALATGDRAAARG